MRKSRFTESQIVAIVKVSVSELKRMKELETENAKLKRMYADLALENAEAGGRLLGMRFEGLADTDGNVHKYEYMSTLSSRLRWHTASRDGAWKDLILTPPEPRRGRCQECVVLRLGVPGMCHG